MVEDARAAPSPAHPAATARGTASQLGIVLTALGVAEVGLALAHLVLGWGLVLVLLLHTAIVAAAASHLLRPTSPGADMTPRALIVLATAIAGPIGALAGWLFVQAASQPAPPSPLIEEWYRRISLSAEIDPVTELCDNVASGRTMNLASPVPQSFLSIMISGTVADQQTALGLIARRFHPDYLPALTRALRSPEPVIRVQAAAVVARIRDQLQARVRARIAEIEAAPQPADLPAALAELATAATSGLLDETDRLRAEALVARAYSLAPADHAGAPQSKPSPGYRSLRVARRQRRIARGGAYRVRRLHTSPPKDRRA